MKKSQLKQLIKEEVSKVLNETPRINEIKINKPIPKLKYCWISSHEDYHQLYLASEQSYKEYIKDLAEDNEVTPNEVMEWEWANYIEEIPNNKIIFLGWNDEGIDVWGYNDFHEFLKDITTRYWGEDQLIELWDGEGLNGEEMFEDFYENDNRELDDKVLKTLKIWIDNSEADGDSNSANLLIMNNKIIAGNKDNYYIL